MKNITITNHALEQYQARFGNNLDTGRPMTRRDLMSEVDYCVENGMRKHSHYPNGYIVDEELSLVIVPNRYDPSGLSVVTVIYTDSNDDRR